MTEKQSVDTRAALRWLLGAAMIGGGLRAGVSLAHALGSAPTVKLRDAHELYDPEIQMPVDMTPKQLKKFQELQAAATPAGIPKSAGAWDSTFNVLAGVGGGMAGWKLVDALVKRRRKQNLDQQLDDVRTEIAKITGNVPPLVDPLDPKGAKLGAAWDFLEIAAQRYVTHVKGSQGTKVACEAMRKTSGILDKLLAGVKGVGKGFNDLDPMTKVLLGGGAAVAASPVIPGVNKAVETAGKGVTGAASHSAHAVLRPVGYGIAAALGPVAALSLLYGVNRGFQTSKERNKRIEDLKALRAAIRDQEIKEQPYFKLVPRAATAPEKAAA